ncbi:MAG: extracellular solute-binding protein, partial [Chloroflexales bacterium]|nr:extracellular solute-binding protein [Chloroflexales bacterium]
TTDATGPGAASPTDAAAPAGETAPTSAPAASGEKVTLSVWTYLAADDPVLTAYEQEFESKHPNIDIQHTAVPEDDYQVKVETALAAQDVPDVAFIENRRWMKAGQVVDLSEQLKGWGVDPRDFNSGGLARLTWDTSQGIYAVGDFLGGNVIFYNKKMFDAASLPYPDPTKSLTTEEFAALCTKLAKPNADPTQAVWGCSMPDWGLRINAAWVFGADGRKAEGNLNSDAMKQSFQLASQLDRDGIAAGSSVVGDGSGGGALGSESDLFAQGKLAMTWSDFTEATKYKESGIDFGIMPFFVPKGAAPFVDVWTAPWGTFKASQHPQEALEFLRFIATDAQRLRASVSSDPPLSTKVANEIGWGKGDPVKEQYLQVLSVAPGQPFVPPLPDGAIAWGDVWATLLEDSSADPGPLLDDLAKQAQGALDEGWKEWEASPAP